MAKQRYKLNKDFESFDAGTTFVRIATYGEKQVDDAKLQVDSEYESQSVNVTESELEEFFSTI